MVQVRVGLVEGESLQLSIPGAVNKHLIFMGRMTILSFLPGRPDLLAETLAWLEAHKPYWLWINQQSVSGFAQVEYFGYRVCVSHLYQAREDWLPGKKGY
jgi:hypothetical protein